MRTLAVILPVYNEAESIADFHRELSGELRRLRQYQATMLFVVDRCGDASLDILKKIAKTDPAVRVLALSSRFGHQMSLRAGIDHADADAIIMMDSDGQHPPSLIPRLIEEHERGNDIVYTIRENTLHIGFFKRVSSRLFYRFFNWISDMPLDDGVADFRLISRRVADVFRREIREQNAFLRGLVRWVGFRQAAVRYVVRERLRGQSKYSLRRMIQFALFGTIAFSKKPLRAASVVGMCFALFGFIYAMVVMFQYLIGDALPAGWATLIILLSIFSGTQLVFLGIIGEYIGGIFDEVKRRPHYVVDEKINF